MRIGELEQRLLARFPRESAESWDKVGLSVGRPADEVTGVLVALDVSASALEQARARGANVLLTHHPLAIDPPATLTPEARDSSLAGACAYRAAALGVSVISLHTNLDRSLEARLCLGGLLGLEPASSLERPDDPGALGLGLLADLPDGLALEELAGRAAAAFGTEPRIWGEAGSAVRRVAVLGGSLGSFGTTAVCAGADVVIAGEAGYHTCQDVRARGTSLILLGHDRSEEPFCGVLERACVDAGVDEAMISRAALGRAWWTCNGKERP